MASSQDNTLILAEMPEMPEMLERPKDPLVYDNDTDTSNIQNIMLIDATISSRQIFVDSANTNTFPIIYSYYSDSNELLELLQSKFTHINRVSFVFHDPLEKNKAFLDEKSFFTNDDLILEQSVFSENVSFLKSLITQFSISNIDFLACNSLLYENWKTFYGLLTQETNVIVGASDNLSGNIKYGADWVLENTNTDVRTIYFNDTILDFSEYLQAFSISQSGGNISFTQVGSDIQYSSDDGATWTDLSNVDFPINIVNTSVSAEVLTVKFTADMEFTTSSHYFTCGSEYITFDGIKTDGNRATITFKDVLDCPGLIQNGLPNGGGSSNIIVQNIHVASSGTTTLALEAGWVCHSHYGKFCLNLKVDNCSSEGEILGGFSGGILGRYAAAGSPGTLEISNCYSEGDIGGAAAGGICAASIALNGGKVTITNCYSTGKILGNTSGGICGSNPASVNNLNAVSTLDISNCYSTGEIGGIGAGGICGSNAAANNGNNPGGQVNVTNCYSTGEILGSTSGGICGTGTGRNQGTVTISNCYSTGDIGSGCGGMCGAQSAYSSGNITISNCYSRGEIKDNNAGGICGAQTARLNGDVTISNCYAEGKISGFNAGGICGTNTGMDSGIVDISNCYSTGEITSSQAGGICGAGTTGTTITNSYSLYANGNGNSGFGGMICSGNAIFEATYGANGTWSSADANSILTGIPTGSAKEGDVWGYHAVNTPYYLIVMPTLPYSQNGGTISFRQEGAVIQYSPDNSSSSWTDLSNGDFPINIVNTTTGNNLLTVKFINDMGFTTQSHYFKCGSEYITFDGLKDNQDSATITFNNVPNCLGLIQNGDSGTNGYSNITVQNIHVASFGSTALNSHAGWVCQQYFGKGSSFALIDNCYSTGEIGSLSAGGICGSNAVTNYGDATISNCYSKGVISADYAGGICGVQAGAFNGDATISNCYSTGEIKGDYSGGICGSRAGYSSGTVDISNCYSTGEITSSQAGGICGGNTGDDNGDVTIANSYSLYANGDVTIGQGGMVVSGETTSITFIATYGANGNWSSTDANSKLTGTPTGPSKEGDVWSYYVVNTRYYLTAMPTAPPSLEEITTPLVLDNIISSGAYSFQQLTIGFPEPTVTVSKLQSIEFILNQTHYWNTIKIEDSISGITSFVNKTNNNVKFVTPKLITLTKLTQPVIRPEPPRAGMGGVVP